MRPVRNLVKNNRTRPIGFDNIKSIEPRSTKSGKMLAVEISAMIVAIQANQYPTPSSAKVNL